ncbi:OmpP1/FadL family transporter [Marinobacterium litorale]|uniref:OmpP1/FadL family transporter n=1 Tax=Marinobacterium litorale TaxID=404770 RepID=UPI000405D7DA|nr:outer membrane protein transport protein [Marinobacterium litorale]
MIKNTVRYTSISISLLFISQYAQATEGLRLEGYGPVSRAMGGTAMAQDTGTASIMGNPATMALAPLGKRLSVGADIITAEITNTDLGSGEKVSSSHESQNRHPYFAPQIGYTDNRGKWAWGVGAFALGGLGTEYGDKSFLSDGSSGNPTELENSSRLFVLDIPLALSYRINDRLAFGATVDAVWSGMNLNMLLGANQVGSLVAEGRVGGGLMPTLGGLPALDGAHLSFTKDKPLSSGADAWGVSGRIGLIWQATPTTVVGAAYNLGTKLNDLKGKARLTASDAVLGNIPLDGSIRIKDFQMPASLTAGITHKVNDRWRISADLSRVFWNDVLKDIDVSFTSAGGGDLNISLPQNYKDQTIIALGTSYDIGNWTLRAGYRQGTEVVPSENLFVTLPVTPTRIASMGFSYRIAKSGQIDFAYSHNFEIERTNGASTNTGNPVRNKESQNNFVIGYTARF